MYKCVICNEPVDTHGECSDAKCLQIRELEEDARIRYGNYTRKATECIKAKQHVAKLKAELSSKVMALADTEALLLGTEERLRDKVIEIAALEADKKALESLRKDDVEALSNLNSLLQETNTKLETEMCELDKQLAEKDVEISRLRRIISDTCRSHMNKICDCPCCKEVKDYYEKGASNE